MNIKNTKLVAVEYGSGWIRVSRGRTSIQWNFWRPTWAAKCLPVLDVRRNVPTAHRRRQWAAEAAHD